MSGCASRWLPLGWGPLPAWWGLVGGLVIDSRTPNSPHPIHHILDRNPRQLEQVGGPGVRVAAMHAAYESHLGRLDVFGLRIVELVGDVERDDVPDHQCALVAYADAHALATL